MPARARAPVLVDMTTPAVLPLASSTPLVLADGVAAAAVSTVFGAVVVVAGATVAVWGFLWLVRLLAPGAAVVQWPSLSQMDTGEPFWR